MILPSGKVGYRRLYGPARDTPGRALFRFLGPQAVVSLGEDAGLGAPSSYSVEVRLERFPPPRRGDVPGCRWVPATNTLESFEACATAGVPGSRSGAGDEGLTDVQGTVQDLRGEP